MPPESGPSAVDVLVVGAGPAGLAAAIEAATAGLGVLVVDENARPGGQIYRQPPEAFSPAGPGRRRQSSAGSALIGRVHRLGVTVLQNATVWGQLEPGVVEIAHGTESVRVRARAVILAVGANDRPVPLPGWTLPGVMTAGGAQGLLKGQRVVPGGRILLAGAGPLLLVVASQLVEAGADLVAVAEAVPLRAHAPHVLDLLYGGRTLLDGARYARTIRKARVPWLSPSILTRVEGRDRVEGAVVARADAEWRPVKGTETLLEVDTVCMGYGLVPSVEVARSLGCAMRYEADGDAWVPVRDQNCETTVPDVFAVGDGARVSGVKMAIEEGRLAGLVAAARVRRAGLDAAARRRSSAARRRIRRLNRFASAIRTIYSPGEGLYELADATTVVCRCEEVTLATLRSALGAGARNHAQLKAWTRVGMGPCQSKMCGAAVARLTARHTGRAVADVELPSVRPPVRPIPLTALVGD